MTTDDTLVTQDRRKVQVIPPDFDNLLTIKCSSAAEAKDAARRLREDFAEHGDAKTRPEIEAALKRCRIFQKGDGSDK